MYALSSRIKWTYNFAAGSLWKKYLNVTANLDLVAQLIPLDRGQMAEDSNPDGRRKWLDRLLCPPSLTPQGKRNIKKCLILWWDQKTTCWGEKVSPKSHFLRPQQQLHVKGLTMAWVHNWAVNLEGGTISVFPHIAAPRVKLATALCIQYFSWDRASNIPAPQILTMLKISHICSIWYKSPKTFM